jgi:UDP-N-acetylmuramyl-tripeptide synthetase
MQLLQTPQAAAQWLRQHATKDLQSDSRRVQAGDAFLAWPAGVTDPREYVDAALSQGAAACLVEHAGLDAFSWNDARVASYQDLKAEGGKIAAEFFGQPSQALQIAAVTGTNGKTSTAWWLAQALSSLPNEKKLPCGVVGTLGVGRVPVANAQGSLAESVLVSTGFTTPDPVILQKTLRQFVNEGLRASAMEASSIGLEEQRLQGTRIQVAIFTNFTQDHLDYHGSMQAYWNSKLRLFNWPGLAHAVVNIDDPQGIDLAAALQTRGLDVWTTSSRQEARIMAKGIRYTERGLAFEVHEAAQKTTLETCVIGNFNVANLLGVIGAMRSMGVALQDAVSACAKLLPVPGRMECLAQPDAPLVAVDYAHTPDALGQALDSLRPLTEKRGGKLWCVFGCGGDRDSTKRPMMGALAAQKADGVVVTSDNPRTEKPEAIIAQILLGMSSAQGVQVQSDRAHAIAEAIAQAADEDVILLAGKGHESTQEVAGQKIEFSDRAHALAALVRRKACRTGDGA